jgi:hypothetical protein
MVRMTTLARRITTAPIAWLFRAGVAWFALYVAWLASSHVGPRWLVEALGAMTLAGLVAIVLALALRAAYLRGQRAADAWYEPRLRELREELSEIVGAADPIPHFIAGQLAQASEQRRRLRELNDRVQSAGFWGRSL